MSRGCLGEDVVDSSGEESFDAADDFFAGFAFLESTRHVVAGGLVVAETNNDCLVECCVGLAVSSTVEAVSLSGARRSVDGCCSTKRSE